MYIDYVSNEVKVTRNINTAKKQQNYQWRL